MKLCNQHAQSQNEFLIPAKLKKLRTIKYLTRESLRNYQIQISSVLDEKTEAQSQELSCHSPFSNSL